MSNKKYKLTKLYLMFDLYINKNEIWKEHKDFIGYKISNYGRIKNKKEHILRKKIYGNYEYISFSINNKKFIKLVHRIVGDLFIDNINNKSSVDHINRNSYMNCWYNLRWASRKEQNNNQNKVSKLIKEKVSAISIWNIDLNTNEKKNKFISSIKAAEFIKKEQNLSAKINNIASNIRKCVSGIQSYSYNYKWIKVIDADYVDEVWKNIPPNIIDNIEGFKISNYGRLKNKTNRINKGSITSCGYLIYSLTKKRKHYLCHYLVASVFIENPLNKLIVNHKDGNKSNNHVDNLEWSTYSENAKHAVDTGLLDIKKPIIQYDLDGNKINEFSSITEASEKLNINNTNIGECCNNSRNRVTAGGFVFKFKKK